MAVNDSLMSDNIEKQLKFNDEKCYEKINYFPFTHGDAIEKQRKQIAED